MKVTREAKTAILVIGAILLFIWGYSFLKGRDLFNSYKTYYVIYKDVEGLSPSAPITLNGLVVGKVTGITFTDNETGLLKVEMQVKTDFPISKTSYATLYEPGFIGGKQIAIIPDLKNQTPAEDGDQLKAGLKPGMLSVVGEKLSPLQTKVEATVVSADSLLHNLNNVVDKQTQENLRRTIAEMSATMQEFNKAAKSLNGVISGNKANIDATMANLNKTSANFAEISDSVNPEQLSLAISSLEHSMAEVDKMMADVQAGKGSLGKLLKDEVMYNNLADASNELKLLLADLKNNPKRYVHFSVFGKKGTPYEETPKK
ncbi:MCE family protein [Flavobacterium album]|uniref:MCE family protein n=1 Tax=Flavobacterium album TaxID=2175091 RepID=A0A2S1QYR7_9FLAO|nr:MlaD family protein [Flavobacterium album]AWH85522.1 MCE family protein [Flavobacterium album]